MEFDLLFSSYLQKLEIQFLILPQIQPLRNPIPPPALPHPSPVGIISYVGFTFDCKIYKLDVLIMTFVIGPNLLGDQLGLLHFTGCN